MYCKLLILLSVFLATINIGMALKCYACAGTATSDCAKGRNTSMAVQSCHYVRDALFPSISNDEELCDESNDVSCVLQRVCLKVYGTDYQPKMLARGCGIFPARVDPCTFLQKFAHVQGCKSCKTDLCNNQRSEEDDPVVDMVF